jgi:hypothetical protein
MPSPLVLAVGPFSFGALLRVGSLVPGGQGLIMMIIIITLMAWRPGGVRKSGWPQAAQVQLD